MHRSNYSKIKNGQRELSIDALKKIVKYFGIATDQFINYENGIPTEVTTENKTLLVQVKLIQILEPEEKNMAFKMVDTFLTQKKFKDFFQKNIATL